MGGSCGIQGTMCDLGGMVTIDDFGSDSYGCGRIEFWDDKTRTKMDTLIIMVCRPTYILAREGIMIRYI